MNLIYDGITLLSELLNHNFAPMPITYINRKQKIYYLHQGKTKTGKPKYHFSMKGEGALIDEIPEGFEIYENPEAQVFLRRIPKKLITDQELSLVKDGMEKYSCVDKYIIDVKKETINIYTPIQDLTSFSELLVSSAQVFGRTHEEIQSILEQSMSYSCNFRFVLISKQSRLFQTQRYCYRGSIDDWIEIGPTDQLKTLVKTYIKHIDQDSIYQLL